MSRPKHRPGLLIDELLADDGPFQQIADDFVSRTCTECRRAVDGEVFFNDEGFYCPGCWAVLFAKA